MTSPSATSIELWPIERLAESPRNPRRNDGTVSPIRKATSDAHDLGSGLAIHDFRGDSIKALIEWGIEQAIRHDCAASGYVIGDSATAEAQTVRLLHRHLDGWAGLPGDRNRDGDVVAG